ncbi:MAG: PAS domain-containing protein [Gammaproteobacteria bacterium]
MTTETIQHLKPVAPLAEEDESLFRKIFERSSDPILVIDPNNDLLIDANPAACEALHCRQDELRAAPLSAHFPNQRERLAAFFERVVQAGHGALNNALFGGVATSPVDLSASVLDFSGERAICC